MSTANITNGKRAKGMGIVCNLLLLEPAMPGLKDHYGNIELDTYLGCCKSWAVTDRERIWHWRGGGGGGGLLEGTIIFNKRGIF